MHDGDNILHELQLEETKLSNLMKVQSTYVSQSKLTEFKDLLQQATQKARGTENEEKKNKKLKLSNEILVKAIKSLKSQHEAMGESLKNDVAEAISRTKEANDEKQFYQKSIQLNQQKVDIYSKEYPQYE